MNYSGYIEQVAIITTDKDISDLQLKLEIDEHYPSIIHCSCSLWSITIILTQLISFYCRQASVPLHLIGTNSTEITLHVWFHEPESILPSMVESMQFYYINIISLHLGAWLLSPRVSKSH